MKKITSRILALAAGTIALSSILCSCGGKSLKLIHSTGPSNDNMYAGVMFSEKQGYTFGEKGVVLRTDDDGSTWTKGDHYSLAFQAAYIFDMNNLFLVGDGWLFAESTDGGKTCQHFPRFGGSGVLKGVNMKDTQTGWIWDKKVLGEYTKGAEDYKYLEKPAGSKNIECALMLDAGKGFLYDDKGNLMYTENYGQTWVKNTTLFNDENAEYKTFVGDLHPTNVLDLTDGVIRLAAFEKKGLRTFRIKVYASTDNGKTFIEESVTPLAKEPKSITFNRSKQISVYYMDSTIDLFSIE